MPEWKKLPGALQEAGAWFSGRGPEYERYQAIERKEAHEQGRAISAETFVKAKMLLDQGDLSGAQASFLQASESVLDPAIKAELQRMGRASSSEFLQEVPSVYSLMERTGQIKAPSASQSPWRGQFNKDTGQMIWSNPETLESKSLPVAGMTPQETPEAPLFKDPKDRRDYMKELRKNISTARKDFSELEAQYNVMRMAQENPSAVGDLALVIGYMKMLDPSSVVREGEQVMVRNAQGVLEKPELIFQRFNNGESLLPAQREEIISIALNAYKERAIQKDIAIFDQLTFAAGSEIKAEELLGQATGARWREKRYIMSNGTPISLRDIHETARYEGISVAEVLKRSDIKTREGGGVY